MPGKLETIRAKAKSEIECAFVNLHHLWNECYDPLLRDEIWNHVKQEPPKAALDRLRLYNEFNIPMSKTDASYFLHELSGTHILGTGIRVSELCGLRWCDVSDEGANISQIVYMVNNRALSEDEKKMERVKEAPKTSAGRRFIPFSDGTLPAILEEQKKQQRIERMKAGSCWIGGDPGRGEQYVFATKNGAPADRYNLGRTLRNCLDNAGLKRRGLHALRHTFATLWIQAGQDVRTLSEILGHTSVSFTMQRYVHSDTATKKRGMAVMASYLAE